MAKKRFWLVIPALALVFGMMVVGCPDPSAGGGGGGGVQKTLIIQNVPLEVINWPGVGGGGGIGLFPTGTPLEQMGNETLVASADLRYINPVVTGSVATLNIPLYNSNNTRWTGSGTFDVYVQLFQTSEKVRVFKSKNSISITSETTTIVWGTTTVQELTQ